MTIASQSDKDLADAGRMLCNEMTKIAAELTRRGLNADVQGYYSARGTIEWRFEVKRVTEEII